MFNLHSRGRAAAALATLVADIIAQGSTLPEIDFLAGFFAVVGQALALISIVETQNLPVEQRPAAESGAESTQEKAFGGERGTAAGSTAETETRAEAESVAKDDIFKTVTHAGGKTIYNSKKGTFNGMRFNRFPKK